MIIHILETEPADQELFAARLAAHKVCFSAQVEDIGEDVEILSTFINSNVTAEFIATRPRLRLIATRSTAVDHLPLAACREHGVAVANVPQYGDTTVAEHTIGLMIEPSGEVSSLGAGTGDVG